MEYILLLVFSLMRIADAETAYLKLKNSKSLIEADRNQKYCLREIETQCEDMHSTTCFGTTLTYSKTTSLLTNLTQPEIQAILAQWKVLQSVPKCWAVLQPLLCAVYLPKCENGSIYLPSQEMCTVTRGSCKIVDRIQGWPTYFACKREGLFPAGCKSNIREVKFNTSSHCTPPLVETQFAESWMDGIDGCGLQCNNPFYTSEEHDKVHSFIAASASLCFISNLFLIFTFLIDWRNSNKYPGIVIFYINICFLVNCIGWLAQFIPGARQNIVCRQDGTLRHGEPRYGENLSCIIVFVLIYYSLMAAIIWFVILAYTWHISFRTVGPTREAVEGKTAYFHLVAWSLPLILTIAILALSEVDGDSLTGICFVGHVQHLARGGFLLAPVLFAAVIGGYFLFQGLITLIKVKLNSGEIVKSEINEKIQHMIIRISIFTSLSLFLVLFSFGCHMYEYTHQLEWKDSLWKYVICLAREAVVIDSSGTECVVKSRMNITVVHFHIISVFGAGMLMSSWGWTASCLEAWKQFFYRLHYRGSTPVKLKRHQMIAKVFAQRQQMNQNPFSVNIRGVPDDPLGMNIELNSLASQELSSTWAAAFPKFISRRGALVGGSTFGMRHHSSMSDISQQQVSLDSYGIRRHSLDSQVSVHISEQEWVAHALARHQRRKTRREREQFIRSRNRIFPLLPVRRGSDTSQQSIIIRNKAGEKTMITKATSTGDLNQGVLFHRPPTSLFITRPLIQRQPVNPPFTHGMTDNSHQKKNPEHTLIHNPCKLDPPYSVPQSVGLPMYVSDYNTVVSSHANFMQDPLLSPLVDMYTYLPGSIGCPQYSQLPVGYLPITAMVGNQEPLIPMHPLADSASEVEYFPIRISDTSDFCTDGDYLSHDDAQIISAQRLIQKHSHQITSINDYIMPFPREVQQSNIQQNNHSNVQQGVNTENKSGLHDIVEVSERGSSVPRTSSCRRPLSQVTPHHRRISSENKFLTKGNIKSGNTL